MSSGNHMVFSMNEGPACPLGQTFDLAGLPDVFAIAFIGVTDDLNRLIQDLESLHMDRIDLPMIRKHVLYRWILYAHHFDIRTIGARYRATPAWNDDARDRMVRELNSLPDFQNGRSATFPKCLTDRVLLPNETSEGMTKEPGSGSVHATCANRPHSGNDSKYAAGGVGSGPIPRHAAVHGDVLNFIGDTLTEPDPANDWRSEHWLWLRVLTEAGQFAEHQLWDKDMDKCERCKTELADHWITETQQLCCAVCAATAPDRAPVSLCVVREITGRWSKNARADILCVSGLVDDNPTTERSSIAAQSREGRATHVLLRLVNNPTNFNGMPAILHGKGGSRTGSAIGQTLFTIDRTAIAANEQASSSENIYGGFATLQNMHRQPTAAAPTPLYMQPLSGDILNASKPEVEVAQFVALHPTGRAPMSAKRQGKNTRTGQVKHRLMSSHRADARDMSFIPFNFSVNNMAKVERANAVLMKTSESDASISSVMQGLAAEKAAGRPAGSSSATKNLLYNAKAVSRKIHGTVAARKHYKYTFLALQMCYGARGLFFTLNPVPPKSNQCFLLTCVPGQPNGYRINLPTTWPTDHERAQAVADDPVACARYFKRVCDLFIEIFVMSGALGQVLAYAGTVEEQRNYNLHLHMLIMIKYFSPSSARETLLDDSLRSKFLGYVNSITSSRLPISLANHLRDGIARGKVVADHLRVCAKESATSPEEIQALLDAADSMVANVPVYKGLRPDELMARHKGLDKHTAQRVYDYINNGHADTQTKCLLQAVWPAESITADTRCELPNEDGSYDDVLANSAGKGGAHRHMNDIEKTYLSTHAGKLYTSGTVLNEGMTSERYDKELCHLVALLNADLGNITLLPPPLRKTFPSGTPGDEAYTAAVDARLALVVQAYLTHLHLMHYCIIGTRRAEQTCKSRYARQEVSTKEQEELALNGMLAELRNHGFVVPHNRCAAAAIAVNHANEIVAGGAEFLLRLYYITNYLCKGNYGNEEYKEFLGKLNYYMQRRQDTVDATTTGTERTEMGRLRRMANIVVYASLREQVFGGPIVATYLLGLGDLYQSEPIRLLYVGQVLRPGAAAMNMVQVVDGKYTTKVSKFEEYKHRQCKCDGDDEHCDGVCKDSWLEYEGGGTVTKCGKNTWTYARAHAAEYLAHIGTALVQADTVIDAMSKCDTANIADKLTTGTTSTALDTIASSFSRLEVRILQHDHKDTYAFNTGYDLADQRVYKRGNRIPVALCPMNAVPPTSQFMRYFHKAADDLARRATGQLSLSLVDSAATLEMQCWIQGQCDNHEELAKMDRHARILQSVIAPWTDETLPSHNNDASKAIGTGHWAAVHAIFYAHCAGLSAPLCTGDKVELIVEGSTERAKTTARIVSKGTQASHAIVCTTANVDGTTVRAVVPAKQTGQDVVSAEGFVGHLAGEPDILWPLSGVVTGFWSKAKGTTAYQQAITYVRQYDPGSNDAQGRHVDARLAAVCGEGTRVGVIQCMPSADGSVRIQFDSQVCDAVRPITQHTQNIGVGQVVSFCTADLSKAQTSVIGKNWAIPRNSEEYAACKAPYLIGVIAKKPWDMDKDAVALVPCVCTQEQHVDPMVASTNQTPAEVPRSAIICVLDVTLVPNVPVLLSPLQDNAIRAYHLESAKVRIQAAEKNKLPERFLVWHKNTFGVYAPYLVTALMGDWNGQRCVLDKAACTLTPCRGEQPQTLAPERVTRVADNHEWYKRAAKSRAGQGGIQISHSFAGTQGVRAGTVRMSIDAIDMVKGRYTTVSGACEAGDMVVASCKVRVLQAAPRSTQFPMDACRACVAASLQLDKLKHKQRDNACSTGVQHERSRESTDSEESSSEEDELDEEAHEYDPVQRPPRQTRTPRSSLMAPDETRAVERDPRTVGCDDEDAGMGSVNPLSSRGRAQRRIQTMHNMDELAEGRCQADLKREQRNAAKAGEGVVAPYNSKVHGPKIDAFKEGPDGAIEVAANQMQVLEDCANNKSKIKLAAFESILKRTGLCSAVTAKTKTAAKRCHSIHIAPVTNVPPRNYDCYMDKTMDDLTANLAKATQATLKAGVDKLRAAPEPQQSGTSIHARAKPLTKVSEFMLKLATRKIKPILSGTEQHSAINCVLSEFMRCNNCGCSMSETPNTCVLLDGRMSCRKGICLNTTKRKPKRMQVMAGSPGVGKSETLLGVREYFECNGWGHAILVVSHSGAAVSRVGGLTIDSIIRSGKKSVPVDTMRENTGEAGQDRRSMQYNQQKCQAIIGQFALVLVEEAWTTSSSQVGALHRMFLACNGGHHDLWFGGAQFVWIGDPIQLGPHKGVLALLTPTMNSTRARPGTGEESFGQWIFANAPQDVFVLFEQHRIDDEVYASICENVRKRWSQFDTESSRHAAMQNDMNTLNTRWLAHTGKNRAALLEEIKESASAWHRGVGLTQTNSVSTPLGKHRALAFAKEKGLMVYAYIARDLIVPTTATTKSDDDVRKSAQTSAPAKKRRKNIGDPVPIENTTCAGIAGDVARYNLRETAYTPHTFYYVESAVDDAEDAKDPGLRYTIQVSGDTRGSKQYPSAQFCNRQVGRLVQLYLDPRETPHTTTIRDGVTYLKYAPRAAAFVPDIPRGVTQTSATVPDLTLAMAGLQPDIGSGSDLAFPPNAIPLALSKVRFRFKGKSTGASITVERSQIRAVPYTGITTHAAQGANTDKTVIHFCIRMLEHLRDPALVLVALTRVRRLRDVLLLTPITMEMLEWVVNCEKGVQRQREWDRLVRAARRRKEAQRLPVGKKERSEWQEADRRAARATTTQHQNNVH